MDDPNITMEEYIRLEEEKARKHGKVFNWETAKYGKIWYDEDIYDLSSVESEFPAIACNNKVSSEKTLSREPTVSSFNNKIDFRVSFDDSDDEDYTYIDADIVDFETRLARIYRREVHKVQVFNFEGLLDLMVEGLSARMLMEHRDAQGVWRGSDPDIGLRAEPTTFQLRRTRLSPPDLEGILIFGLRDYTLLKDEDGDTEGIIGLGSSFAEVLLGTSHLTLTIRIRSRYLRLFAAGRKSEALISGVIALALSVIDMAELVRLQIYIEVDDIWAWVAMGPERQSDAAVGAPRVAQDAPVGAPRSKCLDLFIS
ncbi:hypothetical protein Tco_1104364 [Tanacetum coccineum]